MHSTLRNDLVFRVGVGIFARRQEFSPHALKPRRSIRIASSSYKLESACRRDSAAFCSESNCAEYSMQVTDRVRLRSRDDRVLGYLPKFLAGTRCLESTARYRVGILVRPARGGGAVGLAQQLELRAREVGEVHHSRQPF